MSLIYGGGFSILFIGSKRKSGFVEIFIEEVAIFYMMVRIYSYGCLYSKFYFLYRFFNYIRDYGL